MNSPFPVLKGLTLAFVLGNVLSGCNSQASSPQSAAPVAPAAAPSPSAAASSPVLSPTPNSTQASPSPSAITVSKSEPPKAEPRAASPRTAPKSAMTPDPDNPNLLRDYDPMTPLPETGRVTLRADIASLNSDRLITDCPTDTALYAFAESSNYRVQICSQEYDPWMPKYYIGRAKDGGDELRLVNKDAYEARQLLFYNGDYRYNLYRDGARPEQMNAYLEIYSPDDRKTYAEALVYLYEKSGRP
jgi:hypothetical protein